MGFKVKNSYSKFKVELWIPEISTTDTSFGTSLGKTVTDAMVTQVAKLLVSNEPSQTSRGNSSHVETIAITSYNSLILRHKK